MTPKEKAHELFTSHYMILFDSDSDKGEEILISLLAIKLALVTVAQIIEAGPYSPMQGGMKEYWQKVKMELKKL